MTDLSWTVVKVGLAVGWLLVTIAVRDALPGPLGIVLGALWAVVPLVLLFVVARVLGALDRRRLLAEEFRED